MAYIVPKTNWKNTDIPTAQDFNRIEGNIEAENTLLTDILTANQTFSGTKTFPDGIKVSTINDISNVGVTISGVTISGGIIIGMVWGA